MIYINVLYRYFSSSVDTRNDPFCWTTFENSKKMWDILINVCPNYFSKTTRLFLGNDEGISCLFFAKRHVLNLWNGIHFSFNARLNAIYQLYLYVKNFSFPLVRMENEKEGKWNGRLIMCIFYQNLWPKLPSFIVFLDLQVFSFTERKKNEATMNCN